MFEAAADLLNAVSNARRWTQNTYPSEAILLATAATILETTSGSPVGWSWKRLLQRRGNVVFTDARVVVASSTISWYSAMYVAFIGYSAWEAVQGRTTFLGLAFLLAILLFQRRPYRRDIPWGVIRHVEFGDVEGITGRGDIVAISVDQICIQLVTAQPVPEAIRERLLAFTSHRQP